MCEKRASLVAQLIKNPPAMWDWSLGNLGLIPGKKGVQLHTLPYVQFSQYQLLRRSFLHQIVLTFYQSSMYVNVRDYLWDLSSSNDLYVYLYSCIILSWLLSFSTTFWNCNIWILALFYSFKIVFVSLDFLNFHM